MFFVGGLVRRGRKIILIVIIAVILITLGYLAYMQPKSSNYSFEDGLFLMDNAWLDNGIDFYSALDNKILVSLPDSAFDNIESKISALNSGFKNKALKDLAAIYLSFVEQYRLARDIAITASDFDSLPDSDKCNSLFKADLVYEISQKLVAKIKENNSLILEFAKAHKEEYEKTKLSTKLFSEEALKGLTSDLYAIQKAIAAAKAACE